MFDALGFRYTAIQPTLYMICSYLLQNLILCIESSIPSDHKDQTPITGVLQPENDSMQECFLRAIIHPRSSLQIKSSSQWLYPAKIISVLWQNETIFFPKLHRRYFAYSPEFRSVFLIVLLGLKLLPLSIVLLGTLLLSVSNETLFSKSGESSKGSDLT